MEEEFYYDAQTSDLPFEGRIWSLRDLLPFEAESLPLRPSTIHESLRLFNDGRDLWNCKIPINDEDESVFPKDHQEDHLETHYNETNKPSIVTSNQTSNLLKVSLPLGIKTERVFPSRVVGSYSKTPKIFKIIKNKAQKQQSSSKSRKNGRRQSKTFIMEKETESQETISREMNESIPNEN